MRFTFEVVVSKSMLVIRDERLDVNKTTLHCNDETLDSYKKIGEIMDITGETRILCPWERMTTTFTSTTDTSRKTSSRVLFRKSKKVFIILWSETQMGIRSSVPSSILTLIVSKPVCCSYSQMTWECKPTPIPLILFPIILPYHEE